LRGINRQNIFDDCEAHELSPRCTTALNEYSNPDKNGNQQRGISKDLIKRIADLMQEVLDGKRGVNFNKK